MKGAAACIALMVIIFVALMIFLYYQAFRLY